MLKVESLEKKRTISKEVLKELLTNTEIRSHLKTDAGRRYLVEKIGFSMYMALYKNKKYTLEMADFHSDLILDIDNMNDFIGILGFRGCAKSTIMEDYAEYCLITGKSKYTMYVGATDDKSTTAVRNIKNAIESNNQLLSDYKIKLDRKQSQVDSKWTEKKIIINGCCIEAKSRGAKVRGVKFMDSRVTLVICDDLEDTENTKNDKIRKQTRKWFFSELVPAMASDSMSNGTKIVMIGNLVHKDCLLSHLDNKQTENTGIIKILKFPLIDENGNITWKALYPDMESIEKQKQKVYLSGEGMGSVVWAREYLLKMVDEEDQIIKDSDIQYYPDEWLLKKKIRVGVGVDFAISKKQTADETWFVKCFEVYNDDGERRLLVSKSNIGGRFGFTETIQKGKNIDLETTPKPIFYPEDVGYQRSAIETFEKNGLLVKPVQPTTDKRSRLISISPYITSGLVLFPKSGADTVIKQTIGFGIEAHDDAMDALINVVEGMLKRKEILIA